ncbi:Os03g0145300 [Oryza sativa Japonica Group]|uniref:Expressed protein n=2 Tax=Oryza sativa subsp. japonica TaxID=39947 RepID=Q10RU9_ORYSJ|nr:expressed protein [Oryza sativa Japonica Group]BAS82262.1 Os03g0145300 [Oryza sativa Japonica Group]
MLMYYTNMPLPHRKYFQTVLCNSPEFNRTVVNHDLHYSKWDSSSKKEPLLLTLDDVENMTQSGVAFGTRFSMDDPVLNHIDEEILHRQPEEPAPGGWCIGVGDASPCSVSVDLQACLINSRAASTSAQTLTPRRLRPTLPEKTLKHSSSDVVPATRRSWSSIPSSTNSATYRLSDRIMATASSMVYRRIRGTTMDGRLYSLRTCTIVFASAASVTLAAARLARSSSGSMNRSICAARPRKMLSTLPFSAMIVLSTLVAPAATPLSGSRHSSPA